MAQEQIASALEKSESPEVRFYLRQALQISKAQAQDDRSQRPNDGSASEEN